MVGAWWTYFVSGWVAIAVHELTLWVFGGRRTKRLRPELDEARRLAEMHRDAHRDWLTDGCGFEESQLPWQLKPMPWEADQAAKGGE